MYDEPKEGRESQVRIEMGHLEKWTIQLREEVGRLADMLKPVMPTGPMTDEPAMKDPEGKVPLVPIAAELSSFSDRLAETNEIVRRLLNNIEL